MPKGTKQTILVRTGSALDIFIEHLKALIKRDGPTINAAARRWRMPQKTIDRLVKAERRPSLESLEEIAEKAGVEPWQLLKPTSTGGEMVRLREDQLDLLAAYERLSDQGKRDLRDEAYKRLASEPGPVREALHMTSRQLLASTTATDATVRAVASSVKKPKRDTNKT